MDANPSVHSHPNLWMLTQKDKKYSIISHAYHQIKKIEDFFLFMCNGSASEGKIHTCSSILPMLGKNVWKL